MQTTKIGKILSSLAFRSSRKIKKLYEYLVINERITLISLFFLVIFTRLPWLMFVSTDNPGDDSAFFINIGKNIAEGKKLAAIDDGTGNMLVPGSNDEFIDEKLFELEMRNEELKSLLMMNL